MKYVGCVVKSILITLSYLTISVAQAAPEAWAYTEQLPDGDSCYYTASQTNGGVFLAMGNAAPESLIQDCESNGSKERAEKDLLKHSHNNIVPEQTLLPVDTYKACEAGAMGRATRQYYKYAQVHLSIVARYTGNREAITRLARAYDYGRLNVASPRDCASYITGR